jgi:hypothetical protein
MRVWTIVNGKIKHFESCKEAAKWSDKNDNREWYYDNGSGKKIGNKTKEEYCKYLSEITGLTVNVGFDYAEHKYFYSFSNSYRMIFSAFTYGKAKSFALGFVLGKNNKGN